MTINLTLVYALFAYVHIKQTSVNSLMVGWCEHNLRVSFPDHRLALGVRQQLCFIAFSVTTLTSSLGQQGGGKPSSIVTWVQR